MIQSGEIGSIVSPKLNSQEPILRKPGQSVRVLMPKDRPHPDNKFSTYHMVGEEAGVRKIKLSKAKKDTSDMWEIEQSEGMLKWINETPADACTSKQDLRDWIRGKSYDDIDPEVRHKKSFAKLYAVTKNDSGNIAPDSHYSRSQDIDGWIRADGSSSTAFASAGSDGVERNLEAGRYKRIMGEELPNSKDYPSPIELSYIKKPGGPPHLMSSAIRQVCHMIAAQDGEVNRNFFYEQDGKIIPKRIIMAFVDPKNPSSGNSEQALMEAGFERIIRDDIRWNAKDPITEQRHMYVLNWKRFQKIREKIEKKTKTGLLDKLKRNMNTNTSKSRIVSSTPDTDEVQRKILAAIVDGKKLKDIRKRLTNESLKK